MKIQHSNWKTHRLGDLCDICRGSSPRPIADQRFFMNGTIPWIKIADATKSGKYLYETKQYVNEVGASHSRYLPKGALVIAASGVTLGYTQMLGVAGCAHDGWLIPSNYRGIDKDFLYYLFHWKNSFFHLSSYGAAIQNINTTILKEMEVTIPSLNTQRKIATILSAYDDLIENNTRRIAILEEMAQAIYREWFVNFRFPGHENVKRVDSPLGKIPEGWKVVKLADCCKLVMGQSPKSEFYNETGEGLPFHQGVTNFGPRYPTHKTFCTVKNRSADQGDILFSVRAPVGRINIANTEMIVGRGVSAIRRSDNAQIFLFHQLKDKFKEEDIMGGGTIFKSVTKNDLEMLALVNPPADLHRRLGQASRCMTT